MMSPETTEQLMEKVSAKLLCVMKGKSKSADKEDQKSNVKVVDLCSNSENEKEENENEENENKKDAW